MQLTVSHHALPSTEASLSRRILWSPGTDGAAREAAGNGTDQAEAC